MKKYNSRMMTFIALSVMIMSLPSCYITRTTVGNGPSGKDANVDVYSSAKQFYLFGGLAALNQADPKKPADGNYQVISTTNFVDGLVTGITADIFGMRTIKIVTKRK
jgi:hypothetical protein